MLPAYYYLQWRHNEHDGVSNHQPKVYFKVQIKENKSSASLAFDRGLHWWLMNSPHKGPVMQKMIPFDDVIMIHIFKYTENWSWAKFTGKLINFKSISLPDFPRSGNEIFLAFVYLKRFLKMACHRLATSSQSIRYQVRKPVLTNIHFNVDFFSIIQAPGYKPWNKGHLFL